MYPFPHPQASPPTAAPASPSQNPLLYVFVRGQGGAPPVERGGAPPLTMPPAPPSGGPPPYPSSDSTHPSGLSMPPPPPQPHQGRYQLQTGGPLGSFGYHAPLLQSQQAHPHPPPVHHQSTVSLGFIPNSRGAQIISFPTYAQAPPPPAPSQFLLQSTTTTQSPHYAHHHGLATAAPPPSLFGSAPPAVQLAGGVTHSGGPPPLEANVKFLHAPAGIMIPPQPVPTYQLVPAGYQVLRPMVLDTNNPRSPPPPWAVAPASTPTALMASSSNSSRPPAPPLSPTLAANDTGLATSLKSTGSVQQARDEQMGDEDIWQEPLILSGTPYRYPVNVGKDVVSGKGGRAQQYNRHFRSLIAEAYSRYSTTSTKSEKREIGIRIYLNIVKGGGRFLDAEGIPMNRTKAILKVMKALKDAKLWAAGSGSLASAAKKRHEAPPPQVGETTMKLEEKGSVELETKEEAVPVAEAVAQAERHVQGDASDDKSDEESNEEFDEESDEELLSSPSLPVTTQRATPADGMGDAVAFERLPEGKSNNVQMDS